MCGRRSRRGWFLLVVFLGCSVLSSWGEVVVSDETWKAIVNEINVLKQIVPQLKEDVKTLSEALENERRLRTDLSEQFKTDLNAEKTRSDGLLILSNQWKQAARDRLVALLVAILIGGIGWLV